MEHSIDREKVIEGLKKIIDDDWMWKHADYYASLISDAVKLLKEQDNCENCSIAIEDRQPVVRCKDCEHSKSYSNGKMFGCEFGNGLREPDWFCADGERR